MTLTDLVEELKLGNRVFVEKRTPLLSEIEIWLTEMHGFRVDPEWGSSYRIQTGRVIAWDWVGRDIHSGLKGPYDFKI